MKSLPKARIRDRRWSAAEVSVKTSFTRRQLFIAGARRASKDRVMTAAHKSISANAVICGGGGLIGAR